MEQGSLIEVRTAIRSLIIATNYTMNIQELQKDYKKLLGTSLPYNSLGFNSAEKLLRSMPDVVKIIGYGPQALIRNVSKFSQRSNHIENFVRDQKSATRTSKTWQRDFSISDYNYKDTSAFENSNTIESVSNHFNSNESQESASKHPVEEVSTHYSNGNGHQSTNYRSQNFRCDEAISKRFDDDTTGEPTTNGSQPLTSKTNQTIRFGVRDSSVRNYSTLNDAIPDDAISDEIENIGVNGHKQNRKNDISSFQNLDIRQSTLFEEIEIGSIISLYISEIQSPLLFFFHIDKENHELLKLKEQMQAFYSLLTSKELSMTESYLQEGRYCAAKIDDTWHRTKILDVPVCLNPFSKIKVFFVDYGCINLLSVKQLKILVPTFFCIPAQAARARLSRIKANEHARSPAALRYFASLVCGRCIYAYVKNVNREMSSFDLILLDTSKQPKCNINDALIKKGLVEKE